MIEQISYRLSTKESIVNNRLMCYQFENRDISM